MAHFFKKHSLSMCILRSLWLTVISVLLLLHHEQRSEANSVFLRRLAIIFPIHFKFWRELQIRKGLWNRSRFELCKSGSKMLR